MLVYWTWGFAQCPVLFGNRASCAAMCNTAHGMFRATFWAKTPVPAERRSLAQSYFWKRAGGIEGGLQRAPAKGVVAVDGGCGVDPIEPSWYGEARGHATMRSG